MRRSGFDIRDFKSNYFIESKEVQYDRAVGPTQRTRSSGLSWNSF